MDAPADAEFVKFVPALSRSNVMIPPVDMLQMPLTVTPAALSSIEVATSLCTAVGRTEASNAVSLINPLELVPVVAVQAGMFSVTQLPIFCHVSVSEPVEPPEPLKVKVVEVVPVVRPIAMRSSAAVMLLLVDTSTSSKIGRAHV